VKFFVIIYTDKNDRLKSKITAGRDAWDKAYTKLFASGINCDQCTALHDISFETEELAKTAVLEWLARTYEMLQSVGA
jgi:hypothetical protein